MFIRCIIHGYDHIPLLARHPFMIAPILSLTGRRQDAASCRERKIAPAFYDALPV